MEVVFVDESLVFLPVSVPVSVESLAVPVAVPVVEASVTLPVDEAWSDVAVGSEVSAVVVSAAIGGLVLASEAEWMLFLSYLHVFLMSLHGRRYPHLARTRMPKQAFPGG